eukprot:GDKI01005657.1.p1 GENE.GDKI01005657.1~~GDKI01005657.1.p1  ORF type:complete len:154 (+),score=38.27 GDKI01005657.1:200-661(+)
MSKPASSGGSPGGKSNSPDPLARAKQEIDASMDVMKQNIQKMAERGDQLNTLQTKSENLSTAATRFNEQSRNLERHFWLESWKSLIMMGVFAVVVLLLLSVANPVLFWVVLIILIVVGGAFALNKLRQNQQYMSWLPLPQEAPGTEMRGMQIV